VLDVALAQITGLTPGTMTVLVGFTVLSSSLLMREQIGWGTQGIATAIYIGVDAGAGPRDSLMLAIKVFHVQPHRNQESRPAPVESTAD